MMDTLLAFEKIAAMNDDSITVKLARDILAAVSEKLARIPDQAITLAARNNPFLAKNLGKVVAEGAKDTAKLDKMFPRVGPAKPMPAPRGSPEVEEFLKKDKLRRIAKTGKTPREIEGAKFVL
jgi:hypothetical protein